MQFEIPDFSKPYDQRYRIGMVIQDYEGKHPSLNAYGTYWKVTEYREPNAKEFYISYSTTNITSICECGGGTYKYTWIVECIDNQPVDPIHEEIATIRAALTRLEELIKCPPMN